ncbi:MAG: hypothetical protein ABL907_26375 [Hyphomicrobium sp.]
MLGLALAIDGCKCSFLRVSSLCKQDGRPLAAILLFVLWWPCLAYSTFAGYSYLHINRTTVSTDKQGIAEERQRAHAAHDQATADLRIATADPLWAATSACTTTLPKGRGKEFCATIIRLRADQAAAAAILTRITPIDANPEVTGLTANTGLTSDQVQFLIAAVPAILVELLASVGFYAIGKRSTEKAPSQPVNASPRFWRPKPSQAPKTSPASVLVAPAPQATSATPPQPVWKFATTP